MRRSEIIGLRISRKGEGLANDCFLLEREVVCLRQR